MTSFFYAGQYGPVQASNALGGPQYNTPFWVYEVGTTTPATLYSDRTKASVVTQPLSTDDVGNQLFFAVPNQYDVLMSGDTLTVTVYPDPSDIAGSGSIDGGSASSVFLPQQLIDGGGASG